MCCLFGLTDTRHALTVKQKNRILNTLAVACEVRGTDATGITYNSGGKLRIYKRPWPARFMRFRVPDDSQVIMGHTRLATQGSQKRNYNNHPFEGYTKNGTFALAHNGVLYNDHSLQKKLNLPKTKIETDSYVAVQLIEQQKTLHLDSLRCMAETVEGSFTFTVLDEGDNLYIVRGDNPLCLVHFPKTGLYLYASTKEILCHAIAKMYLPSEKPIEVEINCGDIIRIDQTGVITRNHFDDSKFYRRWYNHWELSPPYTFHSSEERSYVEELKSVAGAFGYTREMIDKMLEHGFAPEEIEEFLYEERTELC